MGTAAARRCRGLARGGVAKLGAACRLPRSVAARRARWYAARALFSKSHIKSLDPSGRSNAAATRAVRIASTGRGDVAAVTRTVHGGVAAFVTGYHLRALHVAVATRFRRRSAAGAGRKGPRQAWPARPSLATSPRRPCRDEHDRGRRPSTSRTEERVPTSSATRRVSRRRSCAEGTSTSARRRPGASSRRCLRAARRARGRGRAGVFTSSAG